MCTVIILCIDHDNMFRIVVFDCFGHIQNQGQAMPARPALLANSAGRAAKIVELDQLVAKLSRAKLLGL